MGHDCANVFIGSVLYNGEKMISLSLSLSLSLIPQLNTREIVRGNKTERY